MELDDITPLILTYNESANLRHTLKRLKWAKSILIVDSGSTDDTCQIAKAYANVRFFVRPFDSHTNQWNYGLSMVDSEWVLTLDADYVCPDGLADELQALNARHDVYFASFRYCIDGRPLRAALYPARAVLFRTRSFRYVADGHTQLLDINGAAAGTLKTVLLHDDRKQLSAWLASQTHYARLEADKLTATPAHLLGWKDRLRKMIVLAPAMTLVHCLFWKGLILDGWAGVYYTLQRVYAELLLALMLVEARSEKRETRGERREARNEKRETSSE
jgi:glycosyltransferase involved in cell wall biosynthesis